MTSPENFIRDQFPIRNWATLPTIYKTAYAAVDSVMADNPIFQTNSALDNRGRFISYAVDHGIENAIKRGSFDCDCRWRDFAKPTGRYLELRFSHSTASVSQVSDPNKQPRSVVFRENARLRNQHLLPFVEFENEQEIFGKPHFLLLHGHQQLDFAHIGVPSATSPTKFSWLSPNLMGLPHEIAVDRDLPPPENTESDFEELNLLKEDIERWSRDNGDN